ncbi:hypothetical protein CBS14141_004417 [Malassezia furfur]|nr:hypothetical protein CBS14141_004417 [Malassezia furfur]
MTKVNFPVNEENQYSAGTGDDPMINMKGLSRKHILDAVAKSVKRLGTYIDVLQIHRLDRETPKEEIMRALNDVIEQGLVRYIGASSMAAWEFQQLQNIAEKHGWYKFISMQNLYNLLYREEEREMIPYCQATGVGLVPWYSLAAGLLTRLERRVFEARADRRAHEIHHAERLDGLRSRDCAPCGRTGQEKECGDGADCHRWQLSHTGVAPILGLNKPKRIDEAVEALKVKLSEEEIEYLKEPYKPKPVQPIIF